MIQDKDILLISKPPGISSAQMVSRIKKTLGVKKAGHAGTLDKEAEGLLIIGLNQGTKKLTQLQKLAKEYEVKIKLGITTDTDDLSGKIIKEKPISNITLNKIKTALEEFRGEKLQTPPLYSAVKIKGQPAYKLARQGKKPDIKAKTVTLHQVKILKFSPPFLELKLKTSKGFYVRSLARDLGEKIGCGATVASLRRIAIGPYQLSEAISNPQLKQLLPHQGKQ